MTAEKRRFPGITVATESHISRPRIACEISADRIVAARAAEAARTWKLRPRRRYLRACSRPDSTGQRHRAKCKSGATLRESLTAVAARSRDICLIVPDSTTRVMLLDFETIPEKHRTLMPWFAFALKKSLPFEVEHAACRSIDREQASPDARGGSGHPTQRPGRI